MFCETEECEASTVIIPQTEALYGSFGCDSADVLYYFSLSAEANSSHKGQFIQPCSNFQYTGSTNTQKALLSPDDNCYNRSVYSRIIHTLIRTPLPFCLRLPHL